MIKSTIRRSVDGGAYTYGIVEAYILGLATIRLAHGGARLTGIPVTFGVRAGDTVIIDYTSDVPSVRRDGVLASNPRTRPARRAPVRFKPLNIKSTGVPEP